MIHHGVFITPIILLYLAASVNCVAIDSNNNKWVGTGGGLAIYNESGIISVRNNISILPEDFTLYQNYPNPFNPRNKNKIYITNI